MRSVAKRFASNDILSLTGQPMRYDLAESVGPDIVLGDLVAGLEHYAIGYGTAEGDSSLRAVLAELHGVNADDIIVTVGGMQSLFLLAFILCDPRIGDRVTTTRPLFPNARTCMEAVGAKVDEVSVTFDSGYRLDLEAVRATLGPSTKLVSLATPQNPSGVALQTQEVEALLRLMDEFCPDAFLLLDETYREAVYGDDDMRPSFVTLDNRIVSCASLSKCHGAPGLRIGWTVTKNKDLKEQLKLGKFNTVIACSTVDELLALRVLEKRRDILDQRKHHLAKGLRMVEAWVAEHGRWLEWIKPDAGALCCLRLRPDIFDGDMVVQFHTILQENDTRVGLGAWFGDEPNVFRLGFGLLPMDDLEEALSRLGKALRDVAGQS